MPGTSEAARFLLSVSRDIGTVCALADAVPFHTSPDTPSRRPLPPIVLWKMIRPNGDFMLLFGQASWCYIDLS